MSKAYSWDETLAATLPEVSVVPVEVLSMDADNAGLPSGKSSKCGGRSRAPCQCVDWTEMMPSATASSSWIGSARPFARGHMYTYN